MKLHKGRIAIFLSFLLISIFLVTFLCSFAPPVIGWTTYSISQVTETDVDNLIAITDFQYKYGSFNGYVPAVCSISSNSVRVYLVPSNSTWTVTQSGNNFDVQVSGPNTTIMRSYFSSTGFGMQYTSSSASGSDLLFYCPKAGEYVKGQNYVYSTGYDSDVIADCASEWYEAYKVVNGYESALEEAESNGFFDGYNSGFSDGLDQGYGDGFSDGFEDGYRDGEYNGYAEGVSEGYSEGYRDGYDDGYGAAEPGDGEVVTEIVYRDPVEINIGEIISGISSMPQNLIGSSFGFELFGINIAGLLTTLIVLAVGGFIVGLFLKKR